MPVSARTLVVTLAVCAAVVIALVLLDIARTRRRRQARAAGMAEHPAGKGRPAASSRPSIEDVLGGHRTPVTQGDRVERVRRKVAERQGKPVDDVVILPLAGDRPAPQPRDSE